MVQPIWCSSCSCPTTHGLRKPLQKVFLRIENLKRSENKMERKSFFKLLAGGIAGLFVAPKLWMDGLFQMAKSKTCPGCGSRIVPYRVSRIRYVGLLSEHEIQPICFCVSRCLG